MSHILHHIFNAGKSARIITFSKLLCTLRYHITESNYFCIIDILLNGTCVFFCYVATSHKSESFLFHPVSPHALQTAIEIQKISLMYIPAKLVEKFSRDTCLSYSFLSVLIEHQNGRSQRITVFRFKEAYHLISEVILHGLQS